MFEFRNELTRERRREEKVMLLGEIVRKKRFSFHQSFPSWEEAVRASYQPLLDDGTIEECYIGQVIESIRTLGPYIVLAPDIAMPHTNMNAKGVHQTALSFMRVEEPVHFTQGNPENDARLFFSLAAKDPEEHLMNMQQLAELLMTEGITKELLACRTEGDLKRLQEKYGV